MKKHYTVLILVTLLITLSACARPDVDKNDVVQMCIRDSFMCALMGILGMWSEKRGKTDR